MSSSPRLRALSGYFNALLSPFLKQQLTPGAHLYGLPITTESEATFYPAVSCRNVSLGLTILALVATGQPKALGTVLLGFSVMALGDMVVVLGSPGVPPGSMAMHATKLVGMPLVGGRLLGLW